MSDIEGLIRSFQEEGVLNSEGRFTISLERAAKKRQNLLKVSPAWPFLQLVQEAHRREASRIRLKAGRDHVHFSFACPAQPQWWTAAEWLAQRDVERPDQSLILAEAMLALVASSPSTMELVLVSEHEDAKLVWAPDSQYLKLHGYCPQPTQLHLSARYARSWWPFGQNSYPAKVQAEVGQRCRQALVPLELDSLLINDADWSTLPGLSYLPQDLPPEEGDYHDYSLVAQHLNLLGKGFIAPSTRLCRGLEIQAHQQLLCASSLSQCNTLLVSLETSPGDRIQHFTHWNHFPAESDLLALHPTLDFQDTLCVSQQFLVSRQRYHSKLLSRNCAYMDLEKTPAPYLESNLRVVFPVRAPFVSQLCVIQDGVALQVVDCELGIPGTVAILSDPRLNSDADGMKVVRDAIFEEHRQAISQQALKLAHQVNTWLVNDQRRQLARLHPALVQDLKNRFSRIPGRNPR